MADTAPPLPRGKRRKRGEEPAPKAGPALAAPHRLTLGQRIKRDR